MNASSHPTVTRCRCAIGQRLWDDIDNVPAPPPGNNHELARRRRERGERIRAYYRHVKVCWECGEVVLIKEVTL